MYQDLEAIISELSSHDPSIDWQTVYSRVDLATSQVTTDQEIAKHLKYIRGALFSYVLAQGVENMPGFLLNIAKTELLKIMWL